MIKKVYMIEAFEEDGNNRYCNYARNLKTANKIKRSLEKSGYEVIIQDCTWDYKHGAPILEEWIEG